MDGVTILSECSMVSFYICAGVFMCMAFGCIAFAFIFLFEQEYFFGTIIALFVILMAIASAITLGEAMTTTRYKVVVDDSVNFNEFMEVYNIVEQEGDIYTVDLRIE